MYKTIKILRRRFKTCWTVKRNGWPPDSWHREMTILVKGSHNGALKGEKAT